MDHKQTLISQKNINNIKLPRHRSIWLYSMFKTIKFPTRIPDLNSCLSNMYAYYLPHNSFLPLLLSLNNDYNADERKEK
jgi:hypothetical protein